MSNIERYWEAIIEEAVDRTSPPDQSREILARMNWQKPSHSQRPNVTRQKLVSVARYVAAACMLLAIGWLTGVFRESEKLPDPVPGPDAEPRLIAAAPNAEYEYKDDYVELKDGWLLVTTGAPDVQCQGSILSRVDGRVLVHAGSMPTGAQAESVANWLRANRLEQEMITQVKRWIQGVGLAALILSGSALLDGNRIEAQEKLPEQQNDVRWHEITSIMDLDNLPEDATYIEARELSGGYFQYIAEVPRLEGIRFTRCHRIEQSHVEFLAALPSLKYLDFRGSDWLQNNEVPAFSDGFAGLERLGVDLVRTSDDDEGEGLLEAQFENLNRWVAKGVEIELGTVPGWAPLLDRLDKALAQLSQLAVLGGNDDGLKRLGKFENLNSMEWVDGRETELGWVQFCRDTKVEDLTITNVRDYTLHHAAKITSLNTLRLSRVPLRSNLAPLASSSSLRHLHVYDLSRDRQELGDSAIAVDSLTVELGRRDAGLAGLPGTVNPKRLNLSVVRPWHLFTVGSDVDGADTGPGTADRCEELNIQVGALEKMIDTDLPADEKLVVGSGLKGLIARLPNLKVLRINAERTVKDEVEAAQLQVVKKLLQAEFPNISIETGDQK